MDVCAMCTSTCRRKYCVGAKEHERHFPCLSSYAHNDEYHSSRSNIAGEEGALLASYLLVRRLTLACLPSRSKSGNYEGMQTKELQAPPLATGSWQPRERACDKKASSLSRPVGQPVCGLSLVAGPLPACRARFFGPRGNSGIMQSSISPCIWESDRHGSHVVGAFTRQSLPLLQGRQ